MAVLFSRIPNRVSRRAFSVTGSRLAVGSSSKNSGASFKTARAIEIRWASPALKPLGPFPDQGLISFRQAFDHFMDLGLFSCLNDTLQICPGFPRAMLFWTESRNKIISLGDDADLAPDLFLIEGSQWYSFFTYNYLPLDNHPKYEQQIAQGGFPAPAWVPQWRWFFLPGVQNR